MIHHYIITEHYIRGFHKVLCFPKGFSNQETKVPNPRWDLKRLNPLMRLIACQELYSIFINLFTYFDWENSIQFFINLFIYFDWENPIQYSLQPTNTNIDIQPPLGQPHSPPQLPLLALTQLPEAAASIVILLSQNYHNTSHQSIKTQNIHPKINRIFYRVSVTGCQIPSVSNH